jgi:hypothetical protein
VASGPAVTNPPAGPCSGTALRAARDATLAALAESSSVAGYGAARAALVALPAGELADVAAVLALLLGRPRDILLLSGEFAELTERLGDP